MYNSETVNQKTLNCFMAKNLKHSINIKVRAQGDNIAKYLHCD